MDAIIVAAYVAALPFDGLMTETEFDAVAHGLGLDPNGEEIVQALVSDGWRYAPREYCAPAHRLRPDGNTPEAVRLGRP